MIRMSKKGVPHTKDIQRAMVGIRELPGVGEVVYLQLDEFELLLSVEKAQSLSAQLSSKVRRIQDHIEEAAQANKPAPVEFQSALPLAGK